jgi:hypothetical protein
LRRSKLLEQRNIIGNDKNENLAKKFLYNKIETNKTFLNILMKPEYEEYEELILKINGKPYLIKIPKGNVKGYSQALAIIHYKLEHTSPPQKRGRKRIYKDARERKKAFIERHKPQLVKTVA